MKLALYGYGGHAREVAAQIDQKVTFFVDDKYSNDIAKPISSFDPSEYKMMVAVGDSKTRFDIVQKLPKETIYFSYIHPTSLILDDNIIIGSGCFIGAYCILTTNITLGDHSILNRGVQIGHDTKIGNYFSAMPGSVVSGNVTIYDCVYLGTNSSIKEKLSIHSLSIIGLNSGVVKDIKEPGVYGGTPSKIIKL
jgi:sugar O-acyltransferase (sialic acid O-acetyltransferase NeuD family)